MAGGTGAKVGYAVTVVAGVCSLAATLLSIVSICFQAKNYRKPLLQRYVIRILLMVPIYSIASWVSMVSLSAAQFVDPIRDIYEAFTIYTFLQLLINYLHGERALIVMTHGRAPVGHLWPLNHVFPKVDISDPHTFLFIKRGILQYAWIKPIQGLAAIVMKATGVYQEGYIGVSSGYFWSGLVYNVSVCVSLYYLGLFWVCMSDDLTPFRPVPKFLCIKLIIFASYWQGFMLSILVWLGAIPDNVDGYTPDNLAAAIQDALICIEMPLFAIGHWYAFSWHDYADNAISSARMPVKYALRDAFGFVDLIEDTKETFSGNKYNYRLFDSSGKVIAHEDSSQRFARLKDGMRYKRGGEGKYWIPKPGEVRGELNAQTPLLPKVAGPSSAIGEPVPRYSDGSLGETTMDTLDETLFAKARELEFGDWNYPVITAHVPTRERWIAHTSVYQTDSGTWNATGSQDNLHTGPGLRPESPTADSSDEVSKDRSKGKAKEGSGGAAPSSLQKTSQGTYKPFAEVAAEEQAQGPLGAPVITTSEPQILQEEAQDEEEEALFKVGEATPNEDSPGAEESRLWNEDSKQGEATRPPLDGHGDEDDFQNPWGGTRD